MKKTTFLIIGRHAVTEALKNSKRKVHRLFITEDALKKLNKDNTVHILFGTSAVYQWYNSSHLTSCLTKDKFSLYILFWKKELLYIYIHTYII